MMHRTTLLLVTFVLAVPVAGALADNEARKCRARNDSVPTSLGATGWAAVDGPMTGGCGAAPGHVFDVRTRSQLIDALTHGTYKGDGKKEKKLDHRPKIIYVHGTIDLNVDDANVPLVEEAYMRMCGYPGPYYDPVTRDQTGSGGFFGAYKAAYDPTLWIKQSLDPDNRPPALSGPLEEARLCFQRAQAERVMIDVGSNTSIIGVGPDARIINGGLRIGFMNQFDPNDRDNYRSENVVVRNITFMDAFDMFPGWDPKDSFSITFTSSPGCQATYDQATDSGPHRCVNPEGTNDGIPDGTPAYRGGRWNTEYDSIQIMNAEAVWIDHNTFTDKPRFDTQFPPVFAAPFNEATQKTAHHDGHVDVTLLATKVTISNNHFMSHDKGNLLGGSDVAGLVPGYGPGQIDVTFVGNYYQNMIQRMPRVRFGRVHVYNNVFDGDRRQRDPVAEYRLGDTWATGTAAKLVTENNLFDIFNDNSFSIPRIINYASTVANRDLCVAAGFTLAECGTYYYDAGTWVTMKRTDRPGQSNTVLFDAFGQVKGFQESSAANAPLIRIVPAVLPTDPQPFWFPTQTYGYSLAPVGTPEERAALRAHVITNAGAGKLP
jgi:pectate lyase